MTLRSAMGALNVFSIIEREVRAMKKRLTVKHTPYSTKNSDNKVHYSGPCGHSCGSSCAGGCGGCKGGGCGSSGH